MNSGGFHAVTSEQVSVKKTDQYLLCLYLYVGIVPYPGVGQGIADIARS